MYIKSLFSTLRQTRGGGVRRFNVHQVHLSVTSYAVMVGGSNGDGAWRGMVTIFELIDPRPYKNQSPVYWRLIYTVIYMSGRLLTQGNANSYLTNPADLRSPYQEVERRR